MKPQITNRSFHILGLATVIVLGIGSILGSGGSGGGGTTPTPPPNTNFVVFMADKDTDGVTELYKYSLETGMTSKVNGALTTAGAGGNVTSFAISPNRQYIAYVADQDTDQRFELYVRDAALSAAPVKVSIDPVPAAGNVFDDPRWAPDSSRIAFRTSQPAGTTTVLATATPTGSNYDVVSGIGAGNDNVQAGSFTWAPNSSRIAYLADQDSAQFDLYTSPGNTSTGNARLSDGLAGGEQISAYLWAPDSSRIAFRSNEGGGGEWILSTATPVNPVTLDGNVSQSSGSGNFGVQANSFSWSPNSTRLAFIADNATGGVDTLYTVEPDGSNYMEISNGTGTAYDVVGTPSWAPDGSRIAYIADLNDPTNDVFELYTSLPATQGSTRINGLLSNLTVDVETAENSQTAPPAWSPNSASLIYVADQGGAGKMEVYVAAADGSGSATGNTRVSGTPMAGGASLSGDTESWSPSGNYVLYRADQLAAGTDELYSSTSGGTVNSKLTRSSPTATALKSYGKWAPDGSYVAYASTQDTMSAVVELFISTPGGTITNVSGTIAGSAGVNPSTFAWGP